MVLNDEQCERFFDTMDALLLYVNDRFRVVEDFTLDYTGQIGDLKAALVAQSLWDNPEIIDEFVRENPYRLAPKCLDVALGWKMALRGMFAVVRYQNGRALMMDGRSGLDGARGGAFDGVFAVCGVTSEIEAEIGKAPAYVDLVLLPFDDLIVYDGFMQAYDIGNSPEEIARIQDEFENRCAQGIVSTALEFAAVAETYLAAKRDDDIEALLADVAREASGEKDAVPDGFHRGALAGLDPLQREAAIKRELEERGEEGHEALRALSAASYNFSPANNFPRARADIQQEQAVNCAIACVLARGVVSMDDAYAQYRALAPDPLDAAGFSATLRFEASYSDAYFGLWKFQGKEYLEYYTLTPDYLAQLASQQGRWDGLREELDYYESYKRELIATRNETQPRPLPRTLLENTPLGELVGDSSVVRLRRFLDERIPDGQDDYTFADLAVQEFVFTAIESGSPDELFRLRADLGIDACTTDLDRLDRLTINVFNAMPSWENNGWSPQELYENLTGRRVFFNEDGTPQRPAPGDPCPCGSGKPYRACCGR